MGSTDRVSARVLCTLRHAEWGILYCALWKLTGHGRRARGPWRSKWRLREGLRARRRQHVLRMLGVVRPGRCRVRCRRGGGGLARAAWTRRSAGGCGGV